MNQNRELSYFVPVCVSVPASENIHECDLSRSACSGIGESIGTDSGSRQIDKICIALRQLMFGGS
jgi:hypothetical protein